MCYPVTACFLSITCYVVTGKLCVLAITCCVSAVAHRVVHVAQAAVQGSGPAASSFLLNSSNAFYHVVVTLLEM